MYTSSSILVWNNLGFVHLIYVRFPTHIVGQVIRSSVKSFGEDHMQGQDSVQKLKYQKELIRGSKDNSLGKS